MSVRVQYTMSDEMAALVERERGPLSVQEFITLALWQMTRGQTPPPPQPSKHQFAPSMLSFD